jgi:hypothetical protein
LKSTSGVLTGVGLHHYRSNILDLKETQLESKIKVVRDEKLDKVSNDSSETMTKF